MSIGYDNWKINHEQLVAMTFEEMAGGNNDVIHDRARGLTLVHHTMTLHSVAATMAFIQLASGYPTIVFDPTTPDFIDCGIGPTGDLDFIGGDFSLAAWICVSDLTANRMIMCRGLLDTDGWHCAVLMNGTVVLYTSQTGVGLNQSSYTAAGVIVLNTWYLVGFTRTGASVRVYVNGRDRTDTVGVHVNPVASARELHIGIYDNEVGSPWSGSMAFPRIWDRCLPPDEMMTIFQCERHWFGV